MLAELKRLEETEGGTIGVLLIDNRIQCFILENQYLDNEPFVSCIPPGTYTCIRTQSPKFNEVFEVCNVPGRSHILFHAGNTADDTYGCLLPGRRVGFLEGKRAVRQSGRALVEMMERFEGEDEFRLVIRGI